MQWKDQYYVRSYQLARTGMNNHEIAESLGVSAGEFSSWVKCKPALKEALMEARKVNKKLEDWIYGRLSRKYRKLWDRIKKIEKTPNAVMKLELLFDKYGEGARKHLFLYALVNSHFNPSQACRKVNVPYRRYKKWIEEDEEFGRMIGEIQEHKENFFEGKLIELVEQGDPRAVLFVNKTRNAGRGYGERVSVEHTGVVRQEHVLEISEDLLSKLSVAARRELLEVMESEKVELGNGRELLIGGELH